MDSLTKAKESPLCSFCKDFFPIKDEAHTTRPFHATAAELLHCDQCVLCEFIKAHSGLGDSHQSYGNSDRGVRSALTSVVARLREPQISDDDVRWATLEIILQSPPMEGSFRTTHTFSMVHRLVASTCKLCPQHPVAHNFNVVGQVVAMKTPARSRMAVFLDARRKLLRSSSG